MCNSRKQTQPAVNRNISAINAYNLRRIKNLLDNINNISHEQERHAAAKAKHLASYDLPKYRDYLEACNIEPAELSLNPEIADDIAMFKTLYNLPLTQENLDAIREKKALESFNETLHANKTFNLIGFQNRIQQFSQQFSIESLRAAIQPIADDLEKMRTACEDYLSHLDVKIEPYLESQTQSTLLSLQNYNNPRISNTYIDITSSDGTSYKISHQALITLVPDAEIERKMGAKFLSKLRLTCVLLHDITNQISSLNNDRNNDYFDEQTLVRFMQRMASQADPKAGFNKEIAAHQGFFQRLVDRNPNASDGGKLMMQIREIACQYPIEEQALQAEPQHSGYKPLTQ